MVVTGLPGLELVSLLQLLLHSLKMCISWITVKTFFYSFSNIFFFTIVLVKTKPCTEQKRRQKSGFKYSFVVHCQYL